MFNTSPTPLEQRLVNTKTDRYAENLKPRAVSSWLVLLLTESLAILTGVFWLQLLHCNYYELSGSGFQRHLEKPISWQALRRRGYSMHHFPHSLSLLFSSTVDAKTNYCRAQQRSELPSAKWIVSGNGQADIFHCYLSHQEKLLSLATGLGFCKNILYSTSGRFMAEWRSFHWSIADLHTKEGKAANVICRYSQKQ